MAEIVVKARKWGNSIGFTVPKETVVEEHIKPNEEFRLTISRPAKKPDPTVFGSLKNWKLDAQKMKGEIREQSDW